jgi:hypothetical protein
MTQSSLLIRVELIQVTPNERNSQAPFNLRR